MRTLKEQIQDLSPEQQIGILLRRVERAENARAVAENLLESRARELDQANRDLREREELLRERLDFNIRQLLAAQRTAAIATVYRERSGKTLHSPEFARLLGLPEDAELDGTTMTLCIHPLDRDRIEQEEYDFYSAKTAGRDHTYDHRIIRQNDGKLRWLRWTLRREINDDGHFTSVSGTVQDITETREVTRRAQALGLLAERRVRALSKLTAELEATTQAKQQIADFLQAVLDAVPQGIAVFDPDLKLAAWNAPLVSLTEIEPEALHVGMPFKTPPQLQEGAAAVPNPGEVKRGPDGNVITESFERELSDGRIVQVDVIGREDGSMVRIYSDVSRFKSVESSLRNQREELTERVDELITLSFELRAAKAEAERANRSKSQFLAMMSHDIRTPMNGVLGLLETLSMTELSPEQRQKLELSRQAGKQLNFLLNEIIEIVRAESGKIALQNEPVDLLGLLQGVIEFWAQANANPRLTLSLDLDAGLPPRALLDPTRLRQLIDNLVSNALKYTEQGQVSVSVRTETTRLRVEVTDSGRGISGQDQQRLFADFSRLKEMPATTGQSAGLGLAICKRVVTAMGGEIGVHSTVGSGSTFWFELPLETVEMLPQGDTATGMDAPQNRDLGLHVLIAEDVETNRIVLTAMLDTLGCTYECVINGAEAVAAAQHRRFDCILMDVNMPEMDGIEATRAIRELPPSCNTVRIVGVTAHALPDTQHELLASGMDALLPKPVAMDRLAAILSETNEPESSAQDNASAILDDEANAALFAALPGEQVQRILAQSISDIEDLSAQYAAASAKGDDEAMRRAAHSLKGVAGNIGAVALARLMAAEPPADAETVGKLAAETVASLRHAHQ